MKVEYLSGAKTLDEAASWVVDGSEEKFVYRKTSYFLRNNDGDIIGKFGIMLAYPFCCGMREIGNFYTTAFDKNYEPEDIMKAMLNALLPMLPYIGAFTLTEHCQRYSGVSRLPKWVQQLIAAWPGANHAQPFYNPNSGNVIKQWVLPIPGVEIPQPEDDE